MSLPVSLFCVLLESTCIFVLYKSFLGTPLRPNKVDIIFYFIPFIWAFFPDSFSVIALFSGQIITFTYFFIQSNKKLLPTIFLLSSTIIVFYFIQGISSLLLFPVMTVLPMNLLPVLGSITTLVIVLLVIIFCPCSLLYRKIINGNFPLKFLVLNTYMGVIIVTLFYKTHMKDFYGFIILIFIAFFLLAFVNICIFYYDTQLKEKQKELLAYEKNRPLFETLIQDIRSNQHEYANRLQSMANLPAVCKDYHSLCSALEKYTKNFNKTHRAYPLLTINMPLIASSLYNLTSMAEKKDITILYDIPSPNLTCRISEHILVDFLHILTQNAIEATENGKYIYIRLFNDEEQFYFETRNPVERHYTIAETNQFFQKGYTTKTEKSHPKSDIHMPHGYGLHELLTQVNKYGGTVSADCIYHDDTNWMIFSLLL